jgi:hypothetical protein
MERTIQYHQQHFLLLRPPHLSLIFATLSALTRFYVRRALRRASSCTLSLMLFFVSLKMFAAARGRKNKIFSLSLAHKHFTFLAFPRCCCYYSSYAFMRTREREENFFGHLQEKLLSRAFLRDIQHYAVNFMNCCVNWVIKFNELKGRKIGNNRDEVS